MSFGMIISNQNMVKSKIALYGYIGFIVCIKTDYIYKDIAEDVETIFHTLNYELECNSVEIPLPKGKNKKIIWINER